ncbi:MAG: sugar ABC transporter substrate-binding protein [Chloroflexota bacterium]|nr:sugar ABC transporter substrate-binding protein [Chloroflexota bacterium]
MAQGKRRSGRDSTQITPSGMPRRRIIVGGTLGPMLGGLAAACGVGGATEQGVSLTVKGPVTVQLWEESQPLFLSFLEKWQAPFSAKHPQIKVEHVARPVDWGPKLTAAIASGTPPDVAYAFGDPLFALQQEKALMVLDPYIRASRLDVQDFLQGIYKAMSRDGQQFALPRYVNTNTIFYNRNHFQRAGLPLPKDDWTHDQLLDAAQKLTRGPQDRREVWGMNADLSSLRVRACSLLWGQCASFNDPKEPAVFTFNHPANVKAFQWVHDLPWRHRVSPVPALGRDAMFTTGILAIGLDATAGLTVAKDAQTDWDIVAIPRGPCGRGDRSSVDTYVIPTGVKTPEAAWALLESLTGKDAARLMAEIMGLAPARKSQQEAWVKTFPGKNLKAALPTDDARPDPAAWWPKAAETTTAINAVMASLFIKNEVSVPDALRKLHEAVVGSAGPAAAR